MTQSSKDKNWSLFHLISLSLSVYLFHLIRFAFFFGIEFVYVLEQWEGEKKSEKKKWTVDANEQWISNVRALAHSLMQGELHLIRTDEEVTICH